MRRIGLLVLFISVTALLADSCIFQNDPLGPNEPPQITQYDPDASWGIIQLETPSDSCRLRIKAIDPEGDQISYRFVIADSQDVVDSVLSFSDTVTFYAKRGGIYRVQGRAYDSEGFTSHNWSIQVLERTNVPPVITTYYPGSNIVQYEVGDTLLFSFEVEDDHRQNLVYKYILNGEVLRDFSREASLTHRFLMNGSYELTGIVWDGEYGDSITWYVTISGEPDFTPPAGICDLEGWTGMDKGTIFLKWTAPGDDGMEGRAAGYRLRTSTVRIKDEYDWKNADEKGGTPMVSPAGSQDSMVLGSLVAGDYVYVCIRAYDDFFNLSPVCSSPHVQIRGYDIEGTVIDTDNGEGIGDIMVYCYGNNDTSRADGYFKVENLTLQARNLVARDELGSGIGDYRDYSTGFSIDGSDISLNIYMLPNYPLIDAQDDRYDDFMDFMRDITETTINSGSTVFKRWDHWPIKVYNPTMTHIDPMTQVEVDLQAAADSAMLDWEYSTGLDIFETVQFPEAADAEIVYDFSVTEGKHHVEVSEVNSDGSPKKKLMIIYPLISTPTITRNTHVIYLHEFGHIIGLDHSVDDGHLMIGLVFPRVDYVSQDEINLVRSIYHLPYIFNINTLLAD